MNRLFKAVLLVLAFAVVPRFVMAEAYIIPQDSDGRIPGNANQVGCDVIDATSTINYGLTTPVALYWIMTSSDVAGNYATLRDTDTLNTTSNVKMLAYANGTGGTSVYAASTLMPFPVPVIFRNGISIKLNQAPLTGGRWHFCVGRRSIGNARGLDTSFADSAD